MVMKINQISGKNMLLILSSPQQNQKVNQAILVMHYHRSRCQHPEIKF